MASVKEATLLMGKVAERFLNLFEGFKGAHGQTEVLTNQLKDNRRNSKRTTLDTQTIMLIMKTMKIKRIAENKFYRLARIKR